MKTSFVFVCVYVLCNMCAISFLLSSLSHFLLPAFPGCYTAPRTGEKKRLVWAAGEEAGGGDERGDWAPVPGQRNRCGHHRAQPGILAEPPPARLRAAAGRCAGCCDVADHHGGLRTYRVRMIVQCTQRPVVGHGHLAAEPVPPAARSIWSSA